MRSRSCGSVLARRMESSIRIPWFLSSVWCSRYVFLEWSVFDLMFNLLMDVRTDCMLFLIVIQAAAIAFYILSSFLIHSFVIQFVITIFFVALDFWTVKNVSGRLLVGLRWWNDINEEGESVWHFESLDQQV